MSMVAASACTSASDPSTTAESTPEQTTQVPAEPAVNVTAVLPDFELTTAWEEMLSPDHPL